MKKLPRKFRDPLIFLGLLIIVPSAIYFISMNFGDQRVHIEKKQWNPSSATDQGIDLNLLKRAAKYIETRLPMARGMIIIRNGRTVYEKYYWKGGPDEKDYLHSLNSVILHALVGIALDRQMLGDPEQSLGDFFPDHAGEKGSLTIDSLLKARTPLIWGDGPDEYWELFFSKDRVAAALEVLQQPGVELNPAANFAASFLLAELIRTVSGMSIFEFAETHLFAPMGITTLAEMQEKDSFIDPFIGFELRTLDLAKFGYMIMNRGVWEGNQVVPEYWAERITGLTDGQGTLGGWQHEMVGVTPAIIARGEGGQFIVLAPDLDMIVAVSSKSRFPLSESSGYSHLFELIFTASDAELTRMAQAVDPEDRPFYEPNFIHATVVPDEIRQFFLAFARDIATQDINRILYHYAKGYETKDDNRGFLDKIFLDDEDYRSMYAFWRKIFYGGTGELEFVHIEKLRIDGNRAYLRGNLKYSYANMNEGSFGWFPLENLVRLRGRWLWLGSPEYGEILDRDEYFDAELSAEIEKFINNCGQSLVRLPRVSSKACFAGEFLYNGLQQEHLHELLQPFWESDSKVKMHITGVDESGDVAQLGGYLDNSLIGAIHLPPVMQVSRQDSGWKWSGNGRQ